MNVIVAGCGRVGSQLATLLSVEGHNVTVIDRDESSFKRLGSAFNGVTIKGLAFDEDILEEAGVRDCDTFAAVTDLDNTNLMAAEVARKIFKVPHVVARLYNPVRERTYQQLGLDYVCGTTLVADALLDKVEAGHGHHISAIGDVEIVEFKVSHEAVGKQVRDVEIDHGFRIAAIARRKTTFVPGPESVFEHGDVVVAGVKEDSYGRLAHLMED